MEFGKLRVALDGPSGAGKSTIAKAVAAKSGLVYVDTGALYRTVGLFMAQHGIAKDDTEDILAALPEVEIELAYENGKQLVRLCGKEVGNAIRTEEASAYASAVSALPGVRTFLLDLQRNLAERGGVIMDGRDIGTVIMPDAEINVFMTASPEERARRRTLEQREKGENVTYEEVLAAILERDRKDSEREAAPLKPAEDAVRFVNDSYGIDECADYIIGLMKNWVLTHPEV